MTAADRLAEAARQIRSFTTDHGSELTWPIWSKALAAYDADAPVREAEQAVIDTSNALEQAEYIDLRKRTEGSKQDLQSAALEHRLAVRRLREVRGQ